MRNNQKERIEKRKRDMIDYLDKVAVYEADGSLSALFNNRETYANRLSQSNDCFVDELIVEGVISEDVLSNMTFDEILESLSDEKIEEYIKCLDDTLSGYKCEIEEKYGQDLTEYLEK